MPFFLSLTDWKVTAKIENWATGTFKMPELLRDTRSKPSHSGEKRKYMTKNQNTSGSKNPHMWNSGCYVCLQRPALASLLFTWGSFNPGAEIMRRAQPGRAVWLSLQKKPRLHQRRSSGRLYSRQIDCSDSRGPWCVRWQADAGGRWQARTRSRGGCQLLIVTVLQNGCCFNILYRFLCNTLTRCAAAWSKNQFSPKGASPHPHPSTPPPFC